MRTLGLRRVALREEAELDSDLPAPARRLLRRPQRGGANRVRRHRPSSSCCSASTSSPGAPPTCWPGGSCSRSVSLDQLGGGSCSVRTWSASWARGARHEDRSHVPEGKPGGAPSRAGVRRRWPATGRADRSRAARQIGLARRGQRLEQLGGDTRSLGDRRRPARRRPPSAQRDAGCLVRARPWSSAGASAEAPRSQACRGISLGQNNDVAFAFTNVMADVEDLFVEADRGRELRVRGRAAAASRSSRS